MSLFRHICTFRAVCECVYMCPYMCVVAGYIAHIIQLCVLIVVFHAPTV